MFAKGRKTVTKDELLSVFTEEQILHKYFPQIKKLPQTICSPLRKDEHPSVGFTLWKNQIVWKDFATGEKGSLFSIIEKLLGISSSEVYSRIFTDMLKSEALSTIKTGISKGKYQEKECELGTVRRDWNNDDFEYWKSYGVGKTFLKKSNTYPISYILLKYNSYVSAIKADKYAYVYIEHKDGIVSQKIYQPFNKKGFKWRSNSNASIWNLWTLLPESGDILIITSSKKDAMCIWDTVKIPSVCPQSEGTELKKQVVEELKQRFKRVFVLYDNDFGREENPGREMGKKIAKKFNLTQIEIPEEYQAKDPSDLYKKYGKDILTKVITTLTKTNL